MNTYNSKEEVVETPVDLADQLGTAVGLRRVNNDLWWLLYGDTMYIKNGTSSAFISSDPLYLNRYAVNESNFFLIYDGDIESYNHTGSSAGTIPLFYSSPEQATDLRANNSYLYVFSTFVDSSSAPKITQITMAGGIGFSVTANVPGLGVYAVTEDRLYVPDTTSAQIAVYNSTTGALIKLLSDPDLTPTQFERCLSFAATDDFIGYIEGNASAWDGVAYLHMWRRVVNYDQDGNLVQETFTKILRSLINIGDDYTVISDGLALG
ncbi:hypothetical protein EUZ85_19240 [Hahella sp. KA22]|uniref:hypothetical protein n=1 Tax=Hahella sp. KA22 TaxID=1628392 RepID=UPI000FDEA425|nr:hypothetical protein [Hahella sp. KA22]AZZ92740.1 hypothetical protein ENC22_16660 [Hahella sp. KA22]QAY56114.1 hypothetical protein EUZ85_19240 [Hahella sp. KA22]